MQTLLAHDLWAAAVACIKDVLTDEDPLLINNYN